MRMDVLISSIEHFLTAIAPLSQDKFQHHLLEFLYQKTTADIVLLADHSTSIPPQVILDRHRVSDSKLVTQLYHWLQAQELPNSRRPHYQHVSPLPTSTDTSHANKLQYTAVISIYGNQAIPIGQLYLVSRRPFSAKQQQGLNQLLPIIALRTATALSVSQGDHSKPQSCPLTHSIFENSIQGIVVADSRGIINQLNKTAEVLLKGQSQQLVGRNSKLLLSSSNPPNTTRKIDTALRNSGRWQGELWITDADKNAVPIWMDISALPTDDNRSTQYVGQFYDRSQEKNTADHIFRLNHFNRLTGLPNRQSIQQYLDQLCASADKRPFAVLHLDINRLKLVNDSLGHQVGDMLLTQVADLFELCKPKRGYLAHLTGDEFIMVIPSSPPEPNLGTTVKQILQLIEQCCKEPFSVGSHSINTTVSIGVAYYPQNGENTTQLLRAVDTAVSHAKQTNRRYAYYANSMNAHLLRRLQLEHLLATALERDEFELYYQPQVNSQQNRTIGFEALIRWHSPILGTVSPEDFIPIAEETGLICPIGAWVLKQACQDMADLLQQGYPLEHVAINLSAAQFLSSDLLPVIKEALRSSGLPAEKLQLEVTESIIIDDLRNTMDTLSQLQQLGATIALDDFGTGYSSLSYLKQLPLNKLKIDRSFIQNIDTDPADAAITRAIIDMAQAINLKVIAEGVEKHTQIEQLQQINCHEIQGFYYAKPMPMAALLNYIQQQLTPDEDAAQIPVDYSI